MSSHSSAITSVQQVPKKRWFDDTTSDNSVKDPRIRALINEIINDSSTRNLEGTQKPSADILPKPSLNIAAEKAPLSEVVAELFQEESHPRTKGDIVAMVIQMKIAQKWRWCIYRLQHWWRWHRIGWWYKISNKRLRKLWKEFVREGKYEHRIDIVATLDELLRQDTFTRDECKQLNTMLAESLHEDMDLELDSGEGDEFKKMIQATTNDLIECEKKELMEILPSLKRSYKRLHWCSSSVGETFRCICHQWIFDGKHILPMIEEIMKTLEGSDFCYSSLPLDADF